MSLYWCSEMFLFSHQLQTSMFSTYKPKIQILKPFQLLLVKKQRKDLVGFNKEIQSVLGLLGLDLVAYVRLEKNRCSQ